jgi:sigma-54 dependent transcriptional regulator, gfr operon transcriptional activator
MIEKLNRYLDRIGKVKELYLLVDMGSLEDIYKGLHIENANIGIINNVSTPIALEIGNGIRNNVEMESILQKTIDAFRVNFAYHIEKHQQKQPSKIACNNIFLLL